MPQEEEQSQSHLTDLEEYQSDTIVHGRFGTQFAEPNQDKVGAFIADILYDSAETRKNIHSMATGRPIDSEILEKQITASLYNDINSNPHPMINTFYKKVDQYTQKFFSSKRVAEQQQQVEALSQSMKTGA